MSYQLVPTYLTDKQEWLRKLTEVVNSLRDGKINSVGSVTLTANDTTTTVADSRAGGDSKIVFTATTSNAAGAVGGMYVSAKAKGSFTITHANTAATDKDFDYVLFS